MPLFYDVKYNQVFKKVSAPKLAPTSLSRQQAEELSDFLRSQTSQAIYNSSFKDKTKAKQRAFLSPAPVAKNPNLIDLEHKDE